MTLPIASYRNTSAYVLNGIQCNCFPFRSSVRTEVERDDYHELLQLEKHYNAVSKENQARQAEEIARLRKQLLAMARDDDDD